MGFHVIIDILGSAIIGGILLMTLLNMKAANVENSYKYYGNSILQSNLITLTELIDNDFKQIGFAIDSSYTNPIQVATPTRLKFYTTIYPNNAQPPDNARDVLEYNFGSDDTTTANPNDTVLTRTVTTTDINFRQSGAVQYLRYGIISFKFRYFDVTGNPVTTTATQLQRNSIYKIQLDITMQSPFIYNRSGVINDPNQYNNESVRWRRYFYPFKNSRNNR